MLHKYIPARLIGAALFFGTVVAMSQPVQFNFRSLDLPAATGTVALGIDPQGDIVGRYAAGGAVHGYLLSKDTVTTIDSPFGIAGTSQAWGINPEGNIVGLYTDYGTVPGGDKFRNPRVSSGLIRKLHAD